MGNILYKIALILVIIWAISFFGGFFTGGIIHIFLVIAIVIVNAYSSRKEVFSRSLIYSIQINFYFPALFLNTFFSNTNNV